MILETRAVPPFMKNGWIIGCSRTRDAVVVDPGDEVDELLVAVREVGVNVRHILLTHAHIDHVTGVAAAVRAFQVPVHMHRDDLFLYERVVQQGAMFGMVVEPQPTPDAFYDGTPVHIGDVEIRAHHTPGHCPGEVCLEVREQGARETHLFVGDSLFAGSIGRTDLPGGNYEVLHHTQLLEQLIDSGRILLKEGGAWKGKKITFHDSCYLGRSNGVYEAPRRVIEQLEGELLEMKRCRSKIGRAHV